MRFHCPDDYSSQPIMLQSEFSAGLSLYAPGSLEAAALIFYEGLLSSFYHPQIIVSLALVPEIIGANNRETLPIIQGALNLLPNLVAALSAENVPKIKSGQTLKPILSARNSTVRPVVQSGRDLKPKLSATTRSVFVRIMDTQNVKPKIIDTQNAEEIPIIIYNKSVKPKIR